MKRCQDFQDCFTNLSDYIMDSRNSKSEGICQGCIRHTHWQKPAITHSVKIHCHTSYITGNTVKNKWKHLRDNLRAELNKMYANKFGDPGLFPSKSEPQWKWFCYFLKVLTVLETKKATCNFSLSILIDSRVVLKNTVTLILTTISLLNALRLWIQYTYQPNRSFLGRLLSEERRVDVESSQWKIWYRWKGKRLILCSHWVIHMRFGTCIMSWWASDKLQTSRR
jgi:hypothetical protein